jgi:hypothetical protein
MVFPVMVNSRIDHDLAEPAFKRTDGIGIGGFEPVDFHKYFQETIVQNFNSIFFPIAIALADRHSIAIERAI